MTAGTAMLLAIGNLMDTGALGGQPAVRERKIDSVYDEATILSDRCADAVLDDLLCMSFWRCHCGAQNQSNFINCYACGMIRQDEHDLDEDPERFDGLS